MVPPLSRRPGSLLAATLLAAVLAVAPAPARTVAHHSRGVPILMYHAVSVPPKGVPFPELYVHPADFAGQMAWLAWHRYHPVTLQRAYDYWTTGLPLPSRPIVISFDDGYLSQ